MRRDNSSTTPSATSSSSYSQGAYLQDARPMAVTPADVKEHPAAYSFVVDMQGIKPADIKVTVEEDNVLKISGEGKREEDEGVRYMRMERSVGKITRQFVLPGKSDVEPTVTVQKKPLPEPN